MTTMNASLNTQNKEEIIFIKKKISKPIRKMTTTMTTSQNVSQAAFSNQVYRQDILENMLNFINLTGILLYDLVMTDNQTLPDESRQGDLFESLCEILTLLKCFSRINYVEILDGKLTALKRITTSEKLLKHKIHQGGNVSDFTIKDTTGTIIAFSAKHKKHISKKATDLNDLDATLKPTGLPYKLGLFVKDKSEISKSKTNDIHKQIYAEVEANNLIFDKYDVIQAIEIFRSRFAKNILLITDFIEFVNAEYLMSPRMHIVYKLHQMVTFHNFVTQYALKNLTLYCIAHKPRSGKSITILLICKYLLEQGVKKILITTAVPSTIVNFITDLDNYHEFKGIQYKGQDDFTTVSNDFVGIVFCSVEYLKVNGKHTKKTEILKNIGFEAIVIDEAHLGGSTDKTKSEIIYVDPLVEDIRKNIKVSIFASGTADKIIKNYHISRKGVSEWELYDEGQMKILWKPSTSDEKREEILACMTKRHGQAFMDCYRDVTLNKDYSKHPTQVLMKHSIDPLLVKEINEYNKKYNTTYGYTYSSLFALKQKRKAEPERNKDSEVIKTRDGDDYYTYEYEDKFALEDTEDGKNILKWAFENIISEKNLNKNTIMKDVEKTQSVCGSRKSSVENPKLVIMYMPTHTGNNNIVQLQITAKRFIEEHTLWPSYNVEYSNAKNTSGDVTEKEYNDDIKNMMDKTKRTGKRTCMLFLGQKGSVGITYHDCDVTISLDDGHNLDNQKQRYSRALTEAEGKTIGINVDMNVQRTYLNLMDIIHKYRKNTKTTKTNAEILYYLYEENIFLFNPQQFNNGKTTTMNIKSYYQEEVENILKEIDDTALLDNIVCEEDVMRECLLELVVKHKTVKKQINADLEGEQQDCPKGEKTKYEVDAPLMSNDTKINDDKDLDDDASAAKVEEELKEIINKTLELCKWLFPYLALMSRAFKIVDFKELFTTETTKPFIISFFNYKKIDFNKSYKYNDIVDIMATIIDNNAEIISNIREIYTVAPSHKLRELIEKHFIPTEDEKKSHSEHPTAVKLCDEMLCTFPAEFWKTPKKVLEPCCGKGAFVLSIFDKFNIGLAELYPDNEQRGRVIMTECIYFTDISFLNVFITTEIMKCHVESICGLSPEYEFNSHIGNTIKLDITEKWNVTEFDAVIGNPPFEDNSIDEEKEEEKTKRKALNHNLWGDFIEYAFKRITKNGYLLFITPTSWMSPTSKNKAVFYDNYIVHLNVNDCEKYFKGIGSKFSYYLIQKKNNIEKKMTNVVCLYNKQLYVSEMVIQGLNFLPNLLCKDSLGIIDKFYNNAFSKVSFKTSCELHNTTHKNKLQDKANEVFKYPVRHTTKRDVRYSSVLHSLSSKKKILMNLSGDLKPIYDDGCLGFTQAQLYLVVENSNYLAILNSKLYSFIFKICKWSGFNIDKVFINIPYIDKVLTDVEIYTYFGLSETEINLIQTTV